MTTWNFAMRKYLSELVMRAARDELPHRSVLPLPGCFTPQVNLMHRPAGLRVVESLLRYPAEFA